MKDAFGNELKVGDLVYYIFMQSRSCATMAKAKVTGFTPKMVKVNIETHGGYDYTVGVVAPHKLVKDRYAEGHEVGFNRGYSQALEDEGR